ncbi:hypothetical protein Bca52824_013161 [Brassica carinata]|uniref:Uncharacterized protein n=1 Tax=Brassica carinata TaxID=52824 RepID=A0A8X7W090_BRACI|nr:hypothetical protein Bca52824_013161 [Brassica carinata]
MALSSSFSVSVFLLIVVSVQWTLVCSEPTILASPAVLPYNRTFDTAASPAPETEAPGPSSGQFNGKIAGISMRLRPDLSLVLVIVGIYSFLSLLY